MMMETGGVTVGRASRAARDRDAGPTMDHLAVCWPQCRRGPCACVWRRPASCPWCVPQARRLSRRWAAWRPSAAWRRPSRGTAQALPLQARRTRASRARTVMGGFYSVSAGITPLVDYRAGPPGLRQPSLRAFLAIRRGLRFCS
jgi:hypothetical protein